MSSLKCLLCQYIIRNRDYLYGNDIVEINCCYSYNQELMTHKMLHAANACLFSDTPFILLMVFAIHAIQR